MKYTGIKWLEKHLKIHHGWRNFWNICWHKINRKALQGGHQKLMMKFQYFPVFLCTNFQYFPVLFMPVNLYSILDPFWENENFPEKSGSVTFLHLWSLNFMQKIRKNMNQSWELCVTDRRSTLNSKDLYAWHVRIQKEKKKQNTRQHAKQAVYQLIHLSVYQFISHGWRSYSLNFPLWLEKFLK